MVKLKGLKKIKPEVENREVLFLKYCSSEIKYSLLLFDILFIEIGSGDIKKFSNLLIEANLTKVYSPLITILILKKKKTLCNLS